MANPNQALIDYSNSLSALLYYDFSLDNYDAVNDWYPAAGTSVEKDNANGSFEPNETHFFSSGVDSDLVGRVNLNTDYYMPSMVFLFKPKEIRSGCIIDLGVGSGGTTQLSRVYMNSNGTLTVSTDYGNTEFITENALVIDEFSIIAITTNGSGSYIVYGSVNNPYIETFSSPNRLEDYVIVGIGSTRSRALELSLEGYYFHLNSTALSQEQAIEFGKLLGVYGSLTIQSNLESTRLQTVVALTNTRKFDANSEVPENTNEISIILRSKNGTLVEFFAFDTDSESSLLTTGEVIPDPTEPLVFNQVSGGGGDPGTGLIAHIAGTVNIDGTAAEREVIVISDDPNGRQVLGEGLSAPDGTFDIEYNDWGGAVIALAVDNYGGEWTAETVIASGTIIHPSAPNGYVYKATSSGTTGTSEPTWSINGTVNDGSVTWDPRPFYRPIASGPIKGEVLEEGTPTEPDATPYRFFRIIITDNNNGGTGYTAISEIELRTEETGTDLTTPSTIINSTSVYQATNDYPVTAMLDNDLNTVWLSEIEVLPITITIDMGADVGISHLVMTRGGADVQSNLDQAPKDFTVEASNDATTWVELNNFVGITGWVANESRVFPIAVT